MPQMMYLIDGVAIRPEEINTIEYLKYEPTPAPRWTRCASLDEFNRTPEAKRAMKINEILIERPKDIFTIDLSQLMNGQPWLADKKAGRLDVTTGQLPGPITSLTGRGPEPPAAPIIPGFTNP